MSITHDLLNLHAKLISNIQLFIEKVDEGLIPGVNYEHEDDQLLFTEATLDGEDVLLIANLYFTTSAGTHFLLCVRKDEPLGDIKSPLICHYKGLTRYVFTEEGEMLMPSKLFIEQ